MKESNSALGMLSPKMKSHKECKQVVELIVVAAVRLFAAMLGGGKLECPPRQR